MSVNIWAKLVDTHSAALDLEPLLLKFMEIVTFSFHFLIALSDLVFTSTLDVRIQVYIRHHYFEGNFAKSFGLSAQNQINNSKRCFVKKYFNYVIPLIFMMV